MKPNMRVQLNSLLNQVLGVKDQPSPRLLGKIRRVKVDEIEVIKIRTATKVMAENENPAEKLALKARTNMIVWSAGGRFGMRIFAQFV